ncbi:hypothetical protein J6590_014481 [Homalodisca vitripennis]|nr:hypothetical protein J6590_014481 [Homalodisca vitripennis]
MDRVAGVCCQECGSQVIDERMHYRIAAIENIKCVFVGDGFFLGIYNVFYHFREIVSVNTKTHYNTSFCQCMLYDKNKNLYEAEVAQ